MLKMTLSFWPGLKLFYHFQCHQVFRTSIILLHHFPHFTGTEKAKIQREFFSHAKKMSSQVEDKEIQDKLIP